MTLYRDEANELRVLQAELARVSLKATALRDRLQIGSEARMTSTRLLAALDLAETQLLTVRAHILRDDHPDPSD